jgi:hypothetical protein
VQEWGGAALRWIDENGKPTGGTTIWSVGGVDGDQFAPGKSAFMVNYRVAGLKGLLQTLRNEGCNVLEKTDDSEVWKVWSWTQFRKTHPRAFEMESETTVVMPNHALQRTRGARPGDQSIVDRLKEVAGELACLLAPTAGVS